MNNIILTTLVSLLLYSCTGTDHPVNEQAVIDSLKRKNDSLTHVLNKQNKPAQNYWYNVQYDGSKLIENGIDSPVNFIERSLREQPALIPLKATLGGSMHFGHIQLLSDKWLIADFDDGHVQGRAIYTYRLKDNGKLEFHVLESIISE